MELAEGPLVAKILQYIFVEQKIESAYFLSFDSETRFPKVHETLKARSYRQSQEEKLDKPFLISEVYNLFIDHF